MAHSSDNANRWLDRELRNISLPEGLVRRLKEIAAGSDAQLDAALGEVALPNGLVARLKSIPTDEALERALRRVELPAGLTARLREIPTFSESELAAQLCDVPVPAGLHDSLLGIARQQPPRMAGSEGAHAKRERGKAPPRSRFGLASAEGHAERRWPGLAAASHAAVAASLLIAASLLYLGGGLALVAAIVRPQLPADVESGGLASDRVEIAGQWAEIELVLPPAEPSQPSETLVAVEESPPVFDPPGALDIRHEPVPEYRLFSSSSPAAVDPLMEVFLSRDLFAKPADEAVSEVEVVDVQGPRGVEPPRVKQFDLLALVRDGVHPFVSPDAHPDLATSHVPLVVGDAGYDLTRRLLREGRLPAPSEIRVEDFLAGLHYNFPLPPQEALGIRTAAGPSPFGESGTSLLQVGVQAGYAFDRQGVPAHLTIALDVSASMGRGERLDRVRRALLRVSQQLSPLDRVSLVAFNEHADVLIEGVAGRDLHAALSLTYDLQPGGPANLGAALQSALHLARNDQRDQPDAAQRVVLVTDGLGDLPAAMAARLEAMVADYCEGVCRLSVIDVSSDAFLDDRLAGLATAGGGRFFHAAGAEAIRYRLLEIASGQPQLVARDARLKVKFNPDVVARYRLLGHEAEAGLLAGSLQADLNAGQAATALFELELKAEGGNDVAEAELTWTDPGSGEVVRARQKISRLQFATSVLESPLSLQQAAIAAQAAEVLRGSPYASSSAASALRQVLEAADRLPPRARQEPSLVELRATIEQAQRVRSGKPAPRGGRQIWWWTEP